MIGRVVSNKMQKSATVLIESVKKHPLYGKTFKRSKKYLVDDAIGVKQGDTVEIVKVRPISKRKHWKINKVLGSSIKEIASEQLKKKATEEVAEVMPAEETKEPSVVSLQPKKETNKEQKKPRKKKGESDS